MGGGGRKRKTYGVVKRGGERRGQEVVGER